MRALWNTKGLGLGVGGGGTAASKPSANSKPTPSASASGAAATEPNLNASTSSKANAVSPIFSAPSPLAGSPHDPDPFDAMQLPFSPVRQQQQHTFRRTNSATYDRSARDRSSALSSAEPSPACSSLFGTSPKRARRSGSHKSSSRTSSQFTAPEEDMLMEILSSQAMIEARDFEVLSWNELERLKKEHQFVTSRMTALQYKLNLEIKMRDATLLMERPDLGTIPDARKTAQTRSTPASAAAAAASALNMSRSETLHNKLEAAASSIASVTADLTRLQQQESELRTKLLRHMAGVLGYVLNKRDLEETSRSAQFTPEPGSSKSLYRFDGPHFFVGSQDAMKAPRSARRRSFGHQAVGSPRLSASGGIDGGGGWGRNEPSKGVDPAVHADLQEQLERLQTQYEQSQHLLSESSQQADDLRRQLKQLQEQAARAEQDHRQLRDESTRAQEDYRQLQADHQQLDDQHASTFAHIDDLQQQLDEAHQQRSHVQGQLEAVEVNYKALERSAQGESGTMSSRLSELEQQLKTAEVHKVQSERLVSELEGQLSSERNLATEKSQQANQLRASVNELARKFELPPLPASRNQPGSDENSVLLGWMDTQLTQGKSRAADMAIIQSRTADLQQQLESKQAELQQARQAIEASSSSSSTLQRDFDQQKQLLNAHESSVASIPKLKADITAMQSSVDSLTSERDVARSHLTELARAQEMQKSEAAKLEAALQDLWKVLPAQRDASRAGDQDDLSAWKKAFMPQPSTTSRLPILRSTSAAAVPSAKYSFETLCERVRGLVADDKKLVDRLIKHEGSIKSSSTSLQAMEATSRQKEDALKQKEMELTAAKKEVEELQRYVESSAVKEAEMLERLNEAQQQAESIRSEKRRLESSAGPSNPRIAELEAALGDAERSSAQLLASEHGRTAQLENQVQAANSEISDLRDTLHDAQEELEDSREREQKGRMQLMDEISKLGREVSSLRTQLRQEQRKAAKQEKVVSSNSASEAQS